MLKNTRFFPARALFALVAMVSLAACGCGNCNVPSFHAPTLPPGATPTPPGFVPPPTTPTPSPLPTPPAGALSCSQGGLGSIALGPALAPFALLAGSTVSNVGLTIVTHAPLAVTGGVNDDLIGVSPGTAVTGFYPPGTDADGKNAIYAASPYNVNRSVPALAQTALTAAYNTAAGEPQTAPTFGGGFDLSQVPPGYSGVNNCGPAGGLPCGNGSPGTLGAGVYKSATSLAIASGNLTLDGGNDPKSVFIFQIGSTLTTTLNGTVGGNVVLTNGASACNIYWQVGSSATLGGQTFYGNVLANQSVTINAVTFTGRALASVAAVSIPVISGSLITNPGGQ